MPKANPVTIFSQGPDPFEKCHRVTDIAMRAVISASLAAGALLTVLGWGLFLAPPPPGITASQALSRARQQWPVASQPGLHVRNPVLLRTGWDWEWQVEVEP